jgi:3-dehydroquinate synthase
MTSLYLNLGDRGYDITVGKGLLSSADKYFNLSRKILVLTDSGVPKEYAEKIATLSKEALIYTIPQGELSKSFATLEKLLAAMMDFKMTRKDALVSVGGGVVGDLGGLASA